jgi:hypothetical protein
MKQDIFELTIQNDVKNQPLDVNNASKEALHALKIFLDSIDIIVSSEFSDELVSFDLGTNKIAIKSTENKISLLNKLINEYRDHKLPKKHKAYHALEEIEKVFTANGLTYTAAIRLNNQREDITSIFKKEKVIVKQRIEVNTPKIINNLSLGLNFTTGKITNLQAKKRPLFFIFEISNEVEYKINLSPESLLKLNRYIDATSTIHIATHTISGKNNKYENWFFEHFSEEENNDFLPFYTHIIKLEGTEKLKFIYRFFNNKIINNEFSRIVKYAKPFLLEDLIINDFPTQRMILDVLKKISDEHQIIDIYNQFLTSVNKKLGSNIY